MFQEKDVGQPKRWGCLVAVFAIVSHHFDSSSNFPFFQIVIISISIVIVIRGLLDTEDEFGNPIIQGQQA